MRITNHISSDSYFIKVNTESDTAHYLHPQGNDYAIAPGITGAAIWTRNKGKQLIRHLKKERGINNLELAAVKPLLEAEQKKKEQTKKQGDL